MIGLLDPSMLPRILEIEALSYPRPWSENMFREEFSNPLGISRGCFADGRLQGYIFGWILFEDLHINNVAVHPDVRRRGAGGKLLKALLLEARERGGERALLEVRPSNVTANALYERFGFRKIAVRKGYYEDTGEDALVLALVFAERPEVLV